MSEKIRPILTKPEKPKIRDHVLGAIMTAEEYAALERHVTPYVFELQAGPKKLYYFGARHTRNPQDPLFAEIETSFIQANPDMVFVEGMGGPYTDRARSDEMFKAASRELTIDKAGEPGFTRKLAVERGIEWHSPEPSDVDLYQHLLSEGFSKEDVFAWEVFHVLPQYHRQVTREGFTQYVAPYIDGFKHATNWDQFDYSLEHALALGADILGRHVDIENEPRSTRLIDPIPWEDSADEQTVLNTIGTVASRFRDTIIVSDILDTFETHNRLFVVYGASHAVMQEPALRKAFALMNEEQP